MVEYVLIIALLVGVIVAIGPRVKSMLSSKMDQIEGKAANVGNE